MYYATSVALETDVIIQRVSSNSAVPGKTPISATLFAISVSAPIQRKGL